jgi:hypothetical protein
VHHSQSPPLTRKALSSPAVGSMSAASAGRLCRFGPISLLSRPTVLRKIRPLNTRLTIFPAWSLMLELPVFRAVIGSFTPLRLNGVSRRCPPAYLTFRQQSRFTHHIIGRRCWRC